MAILLVNINNLCKRAIIALSLIGLAFFTEYSFLAGFVAFAAEAKNTKTQSSIEVFDIKEKDLPAADIPPSSGSANDIPAPDFKEFDDDKFINNLVGDDKNKANGKDSKNNSNLPQKTTAPEAGSKKTDAVAVPNVTPPPVVDAKQAAPQEVPATNNAVPPAAADPTKNANDAQPQATTPPNAEAALPQVPAAENNTNVNGLNDTEKAAYAELNKHLLNFVAAVEGKGEVAEQENKAEQNKQPEAPAAEAPVNTAAAPTEAAKPDAANPNSAQTPPAQPTGDSKEAQKTKSSSPDVLDDLIEPAKKTADAATNQPASSKPEANKITPDTKTPVGEAAKVTPATPTPPAAQATAEKAPAQAVTPTVIANVDKVAEIPSAKPKEVMIEEDEVETPEVREKLSEADKAYFKLLDKKRDSLPESKKLSNASKDVIDGITPELEPVKKTKKKQYVKIQHGTTGEPGIEEDGVIKSQNKMELSVRKVGKGEDFEKTKVKMERAYKALMLGQISAAISIYKDVLDKEPSNKEAMFGLATSYHKNSQFDQARAIYTSLLKKEPGNKEALNNFLVLLAEEAPEDALIELEKLERVNSDFSPIPAQIAMINLKLGNTEKAARYLRRATILSPDNISYKYNLAIAYDKLGKSEEAVQLYRQVADAVRSGAVIPGSMDQLTERMSYLQGKIADKK